MNKFITLINPSIADFDFYIFHNIKIFLTFSCSEIKKKKNRSNGGNKAG